MASDTQQNDLYRRLRSGDEAAFSEIYRSHRPAVYRFSLYLTADPGAAEETVQEVFLAVLRKPEGFDAQRGELTPYLLAIARRLAARRQRLDRRQEPLEEGAGEMLEASDDVFAEVDRARRAEALHQAVLTLPPVYREVVALCDIEGLSYADAAQAAGVSVGSIRSRLHRGRDLLARKLAPLRSPSQEVTS